MFYLISRHVSTLLYNASSNHLTINHITNIYPKKYLQAVKIKFKSIQKYLIQFNSKISIQKYLIQFNSKIFNSKISIQKYLIQFN